jgi:small subunit ribosomal protein S21
MIIVDVTKERNLEIALKKYKNKVHRTKQTEQLRKRQEFVKPSVLKRQEKLNAIYKERLNNPKD